MNYQEQLIKGKMKLAVIGLGYVGMPIAVAFANAGVNVIGFDTDRNKIMIYNKGIDPTNEVGNSILQLSNVMFTYEEKYLQEAEVYIVAVPTPINQDKTPDLAPVISASALIGRNLKRNAIIVYESTVYPGVTEDICVPILEKNSNLNCGQDFYIGYSPERINPGDKEHRLENIKKIVSGMNEIICEEIAKIYELVVKAGVYKVSDIKTAEAVKVAENSQRDINIAFMNELAMVFEKMGINTSEVVEGMNSKWNALGFKPGLVGGHCIGVDPYYFIYKAEKLGYHSQIITAGRRINDGMGVFIADIAIKKMILEGMRIINTKVAILGVAFKENCPDIRNSKVIAIIEHLKKYGISISVIDPWVNKEDARKEYGVQMEDFTDFKGADCIIAAVAHDQFKKMKLSDIGQMFKPKLNGQKGVLIDVKSIFCKYDFRKTNISYWSL